MSTDETQKNAEQTCVRPQDAGAPYLTVTQAANRLMVKPDTLDKWRQLGRGPLFREHGRRIVYHVDDLDAWSDDQKRQTARKYRTSEVSSAPDGDAQ